MKVRKSAFGCGYLGYLTENNVENIEKYDIKADRSTNRPNAAALLLFSFSQLRGGVPMPGLCPKNWVKPIVPQIKPNRTTH